MDRRYASSSKLEPETRTTFVVAIRNVLPGQSIRRLVLSGRPVAAQYESLWLVLPSRFYEQPCVLLALVLSMGWGDVQPEVGPFPAGRHSGIRCPQNPATPVRDYRVTCDIQPADCVVSAEPTQSPQNSPRVCQFHEGATRNR